MTVDIIRDWPVYVGLCVFLVFFVSVIISGNRPDKDSKEQKDKEKK
jgi:hypothetical protein